jgi:hypothetical protein
MTDVLPLGIAGALRYASTTGQATRTVNTTRAVPAGHTLVVCGALDGATPAPSVMSTTDAKSNTYRPCDVNAMNANTRQVFALEGDIASALALGDSVVVASKDGSAAPLNRKKWMIQLAEFAGLIADPLDFEVPGSGGGTNMALGGGAGSTPSGSQGGVAIAVFSIGGNNTFDMHLDSSWTVGGTEDTASGVTDTTTPHKMAWAYKIIPSGAPAAITVTGYQSTTAAWAGKLFFLKGAVTQSVRMTAFAGTGWTRVGGSTVAGVLSDSDDATGMKSPDNPTASVGTGTWAALSPAPATGQTGNFSLRLVASGATSASVDVALKRSGTGTAVQTWAGVTLNGTPTDYVFTMDGTAMAALVANPSDTLTTLVTATAAA